MVKVVLFIGALFGYINALRVEEHHELPVHSKNCIYF